MPHVPAQFIDLAKRVLRSEAGASRDRADLPEVAARCCTALRDHLAPLLSGAGFDALFRRAVTLASRDVPRLAAIIAIDQALCTADGFREALGGRSDTEAADALTSVLAHFISLLVIFIGEHLALRKVYDIWPDAAFTVLGPPSEQTPQ